jgi:hypothetical protein
VHLVVVVMVMFGEGYRTRRQSNDRRKGNRTNLHRFLLKTPEMAFVLSRGNEQARYGFRLLQPLKHALDLYGGPSPAPRAIVRELLMN